MSIPKTRLAIHEFLGRADPSGNLRLDLNDVLYDLGFQVSDIVSIMENDDRSIVALVQKDDMPNGKAQVTVRRGWVLGEKL